MVKMFTGLVETLLNGKNVYRPNRNITGWHKCLLAQQKQYCVVKMFTSLTETLLDGIDVYWHNRNSTGWIFIAQQKHLYCRW
jgi:hypothetical protein